MALRLTVLASGSTGNALLLEGGGVRVLIDAGLGIRDLGRRLAMAGGPEPRHLDALLVTHEHADHRRSAPRLARHGVPVYATAGTAAALGLEARILDDRTTIGGLAVRPVPLPHDAAEPVGLVVELAAPAVRAGVLTDCGHWTPDLARAFQGCDVLVLEANHDPDLLRLGPYRATLKRRVAGPRGHLSNHDAAALLGRLGRPPRVVVLAHLSQVNNRPLLARSVCERPLDGRSQVWVARPDLPLPPIRCTAAGAGAEIQLALPLSGARAAGARRR